MDKVDHEIARIKQAVHLREQARIKGANLTRLEEYKKNTSITPRQKIQKKKTASWLSRPEFLLGVIVVVLGSLAIAYLIIEAAYFIETLG